MGGRSCARSGRSRSRVSSLALAGGLAFGLAATLGVMAQASDLGAASAGTRIAYHLAGASVPGSRSQVVWDPDCNPATQDCWVDESGRSIGQQEVPGAASRHTSWWTSSGTTGAPA